MRPKSDWRPDYDKELIETYRKEHPELIKQMEKEVLQENKKTTKEHLKIIIDKMILPPVLERSERDDTWNGRNVIPLSQVSENIIINKIA